MSNNKKYYKYPGAIRFLHWSMSIIILILIFVGWYMHDLPKEDPLRFTLYSWHKSFGLLILLLWPLRAIIKAIARKPPYYGLADEQTRLAGIIHILMYCLMLLVPLSGYLMSTAGGHGVKFFGWALPELITENKQLADIAHFTHEYLPWILLVFVGFHIAAVVRHHMYDKVNVLKRMLKIKILEQET